MTLRLEDALFQDTALRILQGEMYPQQKHGAMNYTY